MARCDECLHFELCEALEQGNGLMKVHPIHCGYYKPTADVAPRAEVAREIFEEIDAIIRRNTQHAIRNGFICVSGYNCKQIVRLIYELKKKYTEEGK